MAALRGQCAFGGRRQGGDVGRVIEDAGGGPGEFVVSVLDAHSGVGRVAAVQEALFDTPQLRITSK
jgi:hypothetical protein